MNSISTGRTILEILEALTEERGRLAALESDLATVRAAPPRWWSRLRTRRIFRDRVRSLEARIAASRAAADDLIDELVGGSRSLLHRFMEGARARRERSEAARELEYERLEREVAALNAALPPVDEDVSAP